MTPTQKKLGLVALIAFLVWWFFFRPADAVSATAQSGYAPPNDPTRMATDPTLNGNPGGATCPTPTAINTARTGYIRQRGF